MTEVLAEQHRRALLAEARVRRRGLWRRPLDDPTSAPGLRVVPPCAEEPCAEDPAA
jgi:hypothetical protein